MTLLRNWWVRLSILACASLMLAQGHAFAQGSAASIVGQVTDESGGALPGVTVIATSPALQVPSVSAVTDPSGEYRLSPLPIGLYSVTYELEGFQPVRREEIRLTLGFSAKIDIQLKVGALSEAITVSGATPLVDVASSAVSTEFTRETLEVIPTNRNGINSLLVQAPGARGTSEAGGNISFNPPNVRTFGQGAEPWYVFEGVYTSSPQSSGGLGNYWDYASLEEASIQTVGTNAEVPGRGAFVAGVVKSGGNQLHGGASLSYMNSSLQSNNIDEELAGLGIKAGDRILGRYDVAADLGGRIIRDKLWYYGAFRDRSNKFETLGGFGPDGVTPAENTQNQRANVSGKLSYQLSRADRMVLFLTHNRRHQQSVDRFTPWESRVDSPLWTTVGKLEYQRVQKSTVWTAQFGRWGYISPPRATLARGDYSIAPATVDRFTSRISGAPVVQGRSWDYHRYHPKVTVSWYKPTSFGNHEIKAGFEYIYDYGTSPRDKRESPNYQLIFNNAAALQIAAYNYPAKPLQKQNYTGLYVQDAWTIRRRLTLNLGLRVNQDSAWVPKSCREAAAAPSDVLFPAQCFDKLEFPTLTQIAPRLRASLDVFGNGRTVLKGGWGRYNYKRIIEGDIDIADPQNAVTATYRWRDLNGNRDYDLGEVNWNPNGPDFVSLSGTNFVIPNDEKAPKDDQFSIGLEQQIGNTMAVRVLGLYSKRTDVFRLTNLRRPQGAWTTPVTRLDPGPDGVLNTSDDTGRSITYYEFPAALAGKVNEVFTRVNDPKADQEYASVDISITRRLANRWQFAASYSATRTNNPLTNGLTPNEFASTAYAAPDDPNSEIFAENKTWEWLSMISGSYVFPWDITASAIYEGRSGTPWARQVLFTGGVLSSIALRVEPIGTQQTPAIHATDVRLEKGLNVKGGKLKLRLNVYNIMNINTVRTVTERSGPLFNRPTTIVAPRIAEFGVAYTF